MAWSGAVWFLVFFSVISASERNIKEIDVVVELPASKADPLAKDKIHFLLWTRRNRKVFQELFVNDKASLDASNYVRSNPTVIFSHGFTENGQTNLILKLRDNFLEVKNCNFISVDWGLLALLPDYPQAVTNVRPVGMLTGDLVNFLVSQGADLAGFHLIGFSLGAHVVGLAGHVANSTIPRITGLDPAFPLFENPKMNGRLDKSDAHFVDVIHTNAGTLKHGRIGFPFPLGHVDFWPNGGSSQIGCMGDMDHGEIKQMFQVFRAGVCNHRRSLEYFIESVKDVSHFISTKCNSYAQFIRGLCDSNFKTTMGLHVSKKARGNFYLCTNVVPPFARG